MDRYKVIEENGLLVTYYDTLTGDEFVVLGELSIDDITMFSSAKHIIYKGVINWGDESDVTSQILKLRKLHPKLKKLNTHTLLIESRKATNFCFGEFYVDEIDIIKTNNHKYDLDINFVVIEKSP